MTFLGFNFIKNYMQERAPIAKNIDKKMKNYGLNQEDDEDYDEENIEEKSEEVTVYNYQHDITFSKGRIFGNMALESLNQKRNATVLAEEDCYIGVYDNHNYDDIIRPIVDQIRNENIDILLSFRNFYFLKQPVFQKFCYPKFISINYLKEQQLFTEGELKSYIYFIKDGEFQITINKSIFEISEIIKKIEGEKCVNPMYNKFECDDESLSNLMNEKKPFKLLKIYDKEVLGIEDLFDKKYYWFSAHTLTSKNEVFKITKEVWYYNNIE